tara:strand:- start:175 stop:2949 length:2775 start_codon:yes stop_codon:yes gene_type:complete
MPFSYEDEYGRKYFRKLFFKKTLGERETIVLEEGDIALDEDGKIYFGDGTTTGGTELVTGAGSAATLGSFSVSTQAAGTAALGYNSSTGVFTYTPPDLSSYTTSAGLNTAIDNHINVSGASNNQVLSWNGSDYAWVANSGGGGGGIALTDLSVGAEGSASGDGAIAYNNTTGVFTYTPPDLSGYLTSVPAQSFASLTGKPTTIAGYGITDALELGTSATTALAGNTSIPAAYTNSDVDAHLNQSNPTSGYVLSWNGSDYAWTANGTGSGLGDIVDDTTPQLGGTLDANGNTIDMGTNVLTDTNLGQFITAYGWGDHGAAGYQTAGGLNAAIDGHLNQSNPTSGHVLSWNGSDYAWVSNGTASEVNDLSANVTWANIPDANVPASAVTQHQAALTITESQISDLGTYLTAEADTLSTVLARGAATTTTAIIPFYYANQAALPNATTYHGAIGHSHADGAMYFAHGGNWNKLANDSQLSGYQTTAGLNGAIDTHLNQSGPTSGYVLSWNGSDYAWVANSGSSYSNSDVDTHLNQSNPTSGYVLSWNGSDYAWVVNSGGTFGLAANTGSHTFNTATETLTFLGTTGQINAGIAANNVTLELDPNINSIVSISFEGSTADTNETKLQATDPTADRTINLPDATGNIPLLETSNIFTNDFHVEEAYSATPTNKFFEVETGALNNRFMRTGINMSSFGTGVAPGVELTSYRSSPADNNAGPEIVFRASTDSSANSVIGQISSLVYSKTSGAETGEIHLITKVGGSNQGVEFRGRQIKGTGGSLLIDDDLGCTGNVTFDTDLAVGASLKLGMGVEEKFSTTNGATGVTELSCVYGHVHYLTAPAGNVTANFTNLNGGSLTAEYATNVTVIVNQGATARIVSAVQIGGSAQTINWQGGSAPTGTSNGIDAFSFTILNDGGTYVVLGQMVDFT